MADMLAIIAGASSGISLSLGHLASWPESCGNASLMESEENKKPFPSLSHRPWKSPKNVDYHAL